MITMPWPTFAPTPTIAMHTHSVIYTLPHTHTLPQGCTERVWLTGTTMWNPTDADTAATTWDLVRAGVCGSAVCVCARAHACARAQCGWVVVSAIRCALSSQKRHTYTAA